ncbi:MAG: DUF3179 domain-containing protein [Acidobacteriota bacterium]
MIFSWQAQPEQGQISFFDLLDAERAVQQAALQAVEASWTPGFVPMILELLWNAPPGDPEVRRVWSFLERATGRKAERDVLQWLDWLWKQDYEMHPHYPLFKAQRYSVVDPRFKRWFYPGMKHSIRLDEILWGGVRVDGIPPLEYPKFLEADQAGYLGDGNIVFGVYLNGEAKAYPKRILAWHELFNDTIGGMKVSCAYCTLCNAAVLFKQSVGDRSFEFGTSGFLYRSNKLMYDRTTHSLWSALEGVPVTGELTGSGLRLERLPIVTTTWREWKRRHPQTKVLSLQTGHDRNYGEGVAYRDYFASPELMFPVPELDKRLRPKQEVLALLLDRVPVAFRTETLRKQPLFHYEVGKRALVILTDRSGASRAYRRDGIRFKGWDQDSELIDEQGRKWSLSEEALTGPSGRRLPRLPAHRAFWFGWRAQFPHTRLVK